MLFLMTLTLMQGHSGSAKAKQKQRCMLSANAVSDKHYTCYDGRPIFLRDLDLDFAKRFYGLSTDLGFRLFHFRWNNSKPVPHNLTLSKGAVHVVASRGYVDYVINSRVARDLYEWLRETFIPDETFFSTMNHNPQLGVPGSYLGQFLFVSLLKAPHRQECALNSLQQAS